MVATPLWLSRFLSLRMHSRAGKNVGRQAVDLGRVGSHASGVVTQPGQAQSQLVQAGAIQFTDFFNFRWMVSYPKWCALVAHQINHSYHMPKNRTQPHPRPKTNPARGMIVVLSLIIGFGCYALTTGVHQPRPPAPTASLPTLAMGATSAVHLTPPANTEPTPSPPSPTNLLPSNTPTPTRIIPTGAEAATVTHIVDGDTIDVLIGEMTYRVRYIGVNTPERGEPCYAEATAANAAFVSGQTVYLLRDISQTDRYDRLLRYVYVGDVFVNAALVAAGYAEAVEYPPDTAQAKYLESLETEARTAQRACWGTPRWMTATATNAPRPAPTRTRVPVVATQPLPTIAPPPVGNCDPAYPTVCIPPAPPDLDCGSIPYRQFLVLPPDPHHFDRDQDGIGCES